MPAINGRLIRMHGFTPSEILKRYVSEQKIRSGEDKKVAPDKVPIIHKPIIAQWVKQQTEQKEIIILMIAKSQAISEAKMQQQQTKPMIGDLVLVKDFEQDKHHGKKLDPR